LRQQLIAITFGIGYQALEARSEQEPFAIGFGFGQQGQQQVALLIRNLIGFEDLKRLCEIENFSNRGWFLHAASTQGMGESGDLCAQTRAVLRPAERQNLLLFV
jgi:hypothetical protein